MTEALLIPFELTMLLAVERYKAEGYIVPYTVNPIMIDAVSKEVSGNKYTRGIIEKSNQTVYFEQGARFKIIPNSSGGYAGWNFYKVENVKIVNGYTIGDADVHLFQIIISGIGGRVYLHSF
jgi:hypothetical protein